MNARHDQPTETLRAEYRYPIYSPKGSIEGALLHAGHDTLQIVFEPHGGPGADAFAGLQPGASVAVEVRLAPLSDKGGAQHRVYRFERMVSVDGKKSAAATERKSGPPYAGTVVRLNFARHGEANGVVLDSGDFIHTQPDGMARLRLEVGDRVEADGEARPLIGGVGRVVEATVVNGKPVGRPNLPKHG
jgi:hypothetical protein